MVLRLLLMIPRAQWVEVTAMILLLDRLLVLDRLLPLHLQISRQTCWISSLPSTLNSL